MNKIIVFASFAIGVALLLAGVSASQASASSMSIAPLEYDATLKAGEYRKGYVDVVNPESSKVRVGLLVQAFKQVNSDGGLEFYDSPDVTRGIKLDLDGIELGPKEGARIYFQLDASKLPSGDVFAAILAESVLSNKSVQSLPSARVGTLLMIENGTPPTHHAEIDSMEANFWQIGSDIKARFQVKNTDRVGGKALGFIPKINVSLAPYSAKTIDGPLVFASNTRQIAYAQPGDYFGPMLLKASVDGKSSSKLVFAMTGYWRWLAPTIVAIVVLIFVFNKILHIRRRNHNNYLEKR